MESLSIAMLNKVRNSPAWVITMQGSKPGRPHRRIPIRRFTIHTRSGARLTALYASSVIMRPAKRYLRLGLDSLVAILAFVIGIVGLILISH